ncbi:hypothetical protein Tsubulata_025452 [Turnera subulata]|uniref:Peptidase M24 domain-containing protein n=1 Tax=Turnera subulata TaxID=218843 RepID=A0A9Q0FFQ9_9ROSI|nr:hypothetical protein Tsubulata_025452 [Turnera subulata]
MWMKHLATLGPQYVRVLREGNINWNFFSFVLLCLVKPGVRFREVGEVINRHASSCGLSVVRQIIAWHGTGELFHCAPDILHYGKNKAVGVMKAGQTFTIEPMINAGGWSCDAAEIYISEGRPFVRICHVLPDEVLVRCLLDKDNEFSMEVDNKNFVLN